MSNTVNDGRDPCLAPNTFAYILDRTTGEVITHVGPTKVSLADSDQPVVFDTKLKMFREVPFREAVQTLIIAPEGWYVIMKNPSFQSDGVSLKVPLKGKSPTTEANLAVGRKVNLPGPITFPLWPGQMAQVAQGHHLSSNQYLLARVYDEDAALRNRDQAVIKVADDANADDTVQQGQSLIPKDLRIGFTFVIKGTDVSFFIPPTGIEIVRDENGKFVRDAETLELLEYCILLDESGDKRFPRGPSVVFPEATEEFVTKRDHRKFTAFELSKISGLYIKAIKDYVSQGPDHDGNEKGTKVTTGTELFITGETTPVYFPCEEHAIIQYGENKKINYAVAIPSGTGRYVLDRMTGEITTNKGPEMFLPDPRVHVMIRRILSQKEVRLMYPGNQEALQVNAALESERVGDTRYALAASSMDIALSADSGMHSLKGSAHASGPLTRSMRKKALRDFAGDELRRGDSYTPPRTITIDNKYDGVVTVDVWTGYAVNVVNKNGIRRVVTGPNTVMLDYDESLESFYLSKGTPKSSDHTKEDVFLKVSNNRVTDLVKIQTKDLVDVGLTLSYRVNFEGDPNQWFNVDNYVALLTDRLRSILRNEVQKHGIKEFWEQKIDIVRDCVLGAQSENGRPGRQFEQNGMVVYDVDFIDASIYDANMANALISAQHAAIQEDLLVEQNRRQLHSFKSNQLIERSRALEAEETHQQVFTLRLEQAKRDANLARTNIENECDLENAKLQFNVDKQKFLDDIKKAELDRIQADALLKDKINQASLKLRIDELQAQAKAEIDRIHAVTPDLVAAMQTLGHSEMVKALTENLSPLAILGGKSVAEVGRNLLTGTGLEHLIDSLPTANRKDNGKSGAVVQQRS